MTRVKAAADQAGDTTPLTETRYLPVDPRRIGQLRMIPQPHDLLDDFDIELEATTSDAANLRKAADELRSSNLPVAFPTETVYGLGADATRSQAVQGIYRAKQRPSDNPLIVHFASLRQLRALLQSEQALADSPETNGRVPKNTNNDLIPSIYHPLIRKFWPGPLTIILPSPSPSPLAPEVTAGLKTFGARIPGNVLALALIKLADVPVAAPSANASTKPSPTAAEHVMFDLDGRIRSIVDGGPCDVGVESTVVDGLSSPPLILRPGGVSIEQLRACEGWEDVQIGYKDAAGTAESKPKAPGMKYRHYSPRAPVFLFDAGQAPPTGRQLAAYVGQRKRIGVVRTQAWRLDVHDHERPLSLALEDRRTSNGHTGSHQQLRGFARILQSLDTTPAPREAIRSYKLRIDDEIIELFGLQLGPDTASVARGIFAALRELDLKDVDAILIEGIDDEQGETAAAIMNRLRKAAEVKPT